MKVIQITKKNIQRLNEFEDEEAEAKYNITQTLQSLKSGRKYFLSADLWPWRTNPDMLQNSSVKQRTVGEWKDGKREYLSSKFSKFKGQYGYSFIWVPSRW